MAGVVEYGEQTFDDISMFGDNTDRLNDVMAVPSIGQTSIVRYKVPTGYNASVNCMALSCDYGARVLSGAYAAAQDGAVFRFDGRMVDAPVLAAARRLLARASA